MEIALLIIGLVLGFGCLGYFIYSIVKYTKTHVVGETNPKIEGKTKQLFIGLTIAQGFFVVLSSIGLMFTMGWELTGVEYFMLVTGSYLFGLFFDILVGSFALYYYRPDLDIKQRKVCRILMFSVIPLIILSVILLTEGFAKYIEGPLPNAFVIPGGLGYPDEHADFSIAFYGIVIVSGALISYFVTDHYFYKKFKKHGLIDSLFVFAFIFGIIGARLWSCLVLEPAYYIHHLGEIITGIRDGGLAIMGGAIFGIGGGVLFVLIFRKYVDIRFAMDVAVPTILLAQVVGRWGNFFNQEVFGLACSEQSLMWLPTIIRNNMFIYSPTDKITAFRVPLFLIEGIINLGGYFFIRYFLGKVCKMKIGLGYQASFYLIWYGAVRAVLEPLRDGFGKGGHETGFGYMQSWIIAFVLIGVGLLMLGSFYLVHRIRMKKGLENADGEKI